MPRTSSYRVVLTSDERAELERRARAYSSPCRDVVRARIVLMAADGLDNATIGAWLDTPRQVVSKWRKRFHEHSLAGLEEQPRGGRPATFPPPGVVVAIKALACQLPATTGVALSRWHCADLARAAFDQGITASISDTTIWRWLSTDALKPWRKRSWIFPRDPNVADRAAPVLDRYHRRHAGTPLGERDYVLSADEKTGLQALSRTHPIAPPRPATPMRVEHEYVRKGTLAYLAAWDVHRA